MYAGNVWHCVADLFDAVVARNGRQVGSLRVGRAVAARARAKVASALKLSCSRSISAASHRDPMASKADRRPEPARGLGYKRIDILSAGAETRTAARQITRAPPRYYIVTRDGAPGIGDGHGATRDSGSQDGG